MGAMLLLQAAILLLLLLLLEQHPLKHVRILNVMMPINQHQQIHTQRQQEVQGQRQEQEEEEEEEQEQGEVQQRPRPPDACPKHCLGEGGGERQRAQVRGQLGGRQMLSNLPRLKPFCRVTLRCPSALLMLTLPAQLVTLTWAMATVSAVILARSKQRLWQQTAVHRCPAPCRLPCERHRRRRPASKGTFSSWLRN